eukprot:6199756-Pleurochrysis_carterae.AAC.1
MIKGALWCAFLSTSDDDLPLAHAHASVQVCARTLHGALLLWKADQMRSSLLSSACTRVGDTAAVGTQRAKAAEHSVDIVCPRNEKVADVKMHARRSMLNSAMPKEDALVERCSPTEMWVCVQTGMQNRRKEN